MIKENGFYNNIGLKKTNGGAGISDLIRDALLVGSVQVGSNVDGWNAHADGVADVRLVSGAMQLCYGACLVG